MVDRFLSSHCYICTFLSCEGLGFYPEDGGRRLLQEAVMYQTTRCHVKSVIFAFNADSISKLWITSTTNRY
jgi:hypothetical protein